MKTFKINIKNISNRWKIAILAIVVLVVVGAIVYSFVSRDTKALQAETNSQSSSETSTVSNVPSLPGFNDLNWAKNLNTSFNNNDFVFIFIEGSDDIANNKAVKEINTASNIIKSQGVNISYISIDKRNPEYDTTVSRLSSLQLPVLFEVNRNGSGLVIPNITETKILQAYLTLVKACAPGSSCCP